MGLDLYHLVPARYAPDDFYFTIQDLDGHDDYIERHSKFIIEKDIDEFVKGKIIYFIEKGYQRKGVSGEFYTDFENDKLYFDLHDVLKAYKYLAADHINTLIVLQENFKKNFIGNFVKGESIFFINW